MEEIKIHILHCGKVCVDPALPDMTAARRRLAYTGFLRRKSNRIWLPVSAYLIEHPKGRILFDTGWSRQVRDNQKHYLGPFLARVNQAELPTGEAVDEQLAAMGILPADLDYVILSHLDCDHVSGLKMLGGAKNVLISRNELDDARRSPFRYRSKMWEGVRLKTFQFTEPDYGPFGAYFDLFGDRTVLLTDISGHSAGMTAMTVQREGRYALLYADGGYSAQAWRDIRLPGVTRSTGRAARALMWIRDMSMRPNCIESVANHDPGVTPHVIVV